MTRSGIRLVSSVAGLWLGSTTLLWAAPPPTQVLQVVEEAPAAGQASPSGTDALLMVQQLQEEVRTLRGQVEALQFEIRKMKDQERQRYIDLDQRILDLSRLVAERLSGPAVQTPPVSAKDSDAAQTPPPASTPGNSPSPDKTQPPSPEQQRQYQAAFELVRQQKFKEAIGAWLDFISAWPDSDLTANAYYWLGEVYLVEGELEKAEQAFIVVLGRYPDHRKAPDARFKLGVVYHRQGKVNEAREALRTVVENYPDSHAADLAKTYLSKLE
ncbi:tol-pal system protein YbgF [Hahella sp. SMD15-11]|uniref:Cell division coordinator CpoB n=1 Tax=Thermohahella caldifontis TaxID=3142973 RepID=A0AB39UWM9_9GAMM